jgi:hypothetical protein
MGLAARPGTARGADVIDALRDRAEGGSQPAAQLFEAPGPGRNPQC